MLSVHHDLPDLVFGIISMISDNMQTINERRIMMIHW